MKKVIAILLTVVAVSFIAVNSLAKNEAYNGTLIVYGYGVISTDPNLAIIRLSVVTQDISCENAVRMNAEITSKVIESVKDLGNVTTEYYSVHPIYKNNTIYAYRVVNSLKIECSPKVVGKVVDKAVLAGANRIDSISFTLSDELKKELYLKALQLAVEDAEKKTKVVAEFLGLKDVKPSMIEVKYSTPVPIVYKAETPIIPREVEVSASVKITYSFT